MKEVEELMALEAKASKGPWDLKSVSANGYGPYWGVVDGEYGYSVVPCRVDWEGYGDGARKENADFIVAARNLVPKMAQALEALEAMADHYAARSSELREDEQGITYAQVYDSISAEIRALIAEALND